MDMDATAATAVASSDQEVVASSQRNTSSRHKPKRPPGAVAHSFNRQGGLAPVAPTVLASSSGVMDSGNPSVSASISRLKVESTDVEERGLQHLRNQTKLGPTTLPISVNPFVDPAAASRESAAACFTDSSTEELKEDTLFLVQLPTILPPAPPPQSTSSSSCSSSSNTSAKKAATANAAAGDKGATLSTVPSGYYGKLLVYKSGKIKMQVGSCLMDVSLAKSGTFAQNLLAVNVADNCAYMLGDVNHTMVVTPSLENLT